MIQINTKVRFCDTLVIKEATISEIEWTAYLAPEIFVGFIGNQLYLKRLSGPTLAQVWNLAPAFYEQAAFRLGQLHLKAIRTGVGVPFLPPSRSYEATLIELWHKSKTISDIERERILSSCESLFQRLRSVERNGVFLDANPGNWIIERNQPVAIDFGHVSRASFASDLTQLMDYLPCSLTYDQLFHAWSQGIRHESLVRAACHDFPSVRIFSLLCRAAYHNPFRRIEWYGRALHWCASIQLMELAASFQRCKQILEQDANFTDYVFAK